MLLESLGHEVGHLWFLEMRRERESRRERAVLGNPPQSKWAVGCSASDSYVRVQNAFYAVIDAGFFGDIDKNNYLIETLADYVEWRLLGCGFEEWSRSFLFRNLLLAPLIHQDARAEDRAPRDPDRWCRGRRTSTSRQGSCGRSVSASWRAWSNGARARATRTLDGAAHGAPEDPGAPRGRV